MDEDHAFRLQAMMHGSGPSFLHERSKSMTLHETSIRLVDEHAKFQPLRY